MSYTSEKSTKEALTAYTALVDIPGMHAFMCRFLNLSPVIYSQGYSVRRCSSSTLQNFEYHRFRSTVSLTVYEYKWQSAVNEEP